MWKGGKEEAGQQEWRAFITGQTSALGHAMGMLESSYLNTKPGVPVLLPGLEPAMNLLLLQGLIPIFTLPGDKMFQSTGVQQGRHRPPVIHAYGGWEWPRP